MKSYIMELEDDEVLVALKRCEGYEVATVPHIPW